MKYFLLTLIFLLPFQAVANDTCSYTYTVWNTAQKRTVMKQKITKLRSELTEAEKGPFNCTICKEDQEIVTLDNDASMKLCRHVAEKIKGALNQVLKEGYDIQSLVGYRPSKSRGPVDAKGNRTQFSQHAFGVAVDVNQEFNGLYTNCQEWGPTCKLIKGGTYDPKKPLAITAKSPIIPAMEKAGLKWGGFRKDSLKDFMHFSPDGQ
ncbi:M15 family metallopeptidase [bacterium]|nr:M15 family metallopeptidase [bacterium]